MESVEKLADGESAEQLLLSLRDILERIDRSGLPADIGAHVDLACCRLAEVVGHPPPANI